MDFHKYNAWILTDGKAGDEQQCIGIAEALQIPFKIRHVRPRVPYVWLMPYGPIDPAEKAEAPDSPIAPPFPDMVIASGRRSVAYLRAIKKASKGHCFTVFLKDPRTGATAADFIWLPEHDRLRGANVMATLVSPHRIHADRLAEARALADPRLASLGEPKVAVLLGGNSKSHHFTDTDCLLLERQLEMLTGSGASLMVSASRRTPQSLIDGVRKLVARTNGFYWDGTGENPYLAMLACAGHIVVTADSVNMVGEAAATGKPVHVFRPNGGSHKTDRFLNALAVHGALRPLTGELESWNYVPINPTPEIAAEIARHFSRHKEMIRCK